MPDVTDDAVPEQPETEPEPPEAASLTPRQRRFVEEYLRDLNATQAAIRAGYSEATAEQQGPRLLGNAGVATAIRIALETQRNRTGLDADRVVRELERIAFSDPRGIFNGTSLLPPSEWSDDAAAAIQSIKVVTRKVGEGEVEYVAEIRHWPKTAALDTLAKRVWPERRGRPVRFEMPEVRSAADAVVALGRIASAAAAGTLTPEEAQALAAVIEGQRKAHETLILEERIAALEARRQET
ncbi:terminase small subunit [Roseomonas sp. NAR14]|uniref:Terminase small subunit n=1 Tax=Roseomonas acroporae TaxID=2937791 RepID=A0A9X2BZB0_9PROT|nr:terminase small subunit [Roseomonas acroporae]MCK8787814.1 terminase small subunit [Roseomonas acroporae]